jgi:hypothetical protein
MCACADSWMIVSPRKAAGWRARWMEHSAAEGTDDIALQTLVCHLVDPFRVGIVSYDERSALESVILHDVLDPGVVLQAVDGEIFAITGMLETAVWHLGLQRDMTVDPDAAEVQPG